MYSPSKLAFASRFWPPAGQEDATIGLSGLSLLSPEPTAFEVIAVGIIGSVTVDGTIMEASVVAVSEIAASETDGDGWLMLLSKGVTSGSIVAVGARVGVATAVGTVVDSLPARVSQARLPPSNRRL